VAAVGTTSIAGGDAAAGETKTWVSPVADPKKNSREIRRKQIPICQSSEPEIQVPQRPW